MGFDGRFTLGLIFRVAVLMLALLAVVWAFRTPSLVMVRVVTIGIAGIAAVTLWHHVERTNIELARFLEAVRLGDYSAHFPTKGGAGFGKLGGALNDAIRRLRAERGEIDAELRYLEALIDDMPVALLTVDAGRVEPGNKAARQLFARHIGVRPEDYAVYGATFAARLADDASAADEEMLILNLDGRAKRTLVRQATLNRLGRRTRAIVVQPMQETLSAVEMAAQTDIVRVLTHEILNSLTPVMSLAQTAEQLLAGDADTGRIADARMATSTLARRTEGLRHFIDSYRVVAREPTVVRQRFAAAAFAEEHARLFRAEWPDVPLNVAAVEATIDGDRALLSQLLLNLLRNAAQAPRAPGLSPQVALTIARSDALTIEVADNGRGVPAKLRSEIFLPFFTTRPDGTGVGLNLARQIAVAHGGTLEVGDSALGGALFRLVL